MKVIIHLEVTDEERNALACQLAGKQVKRLATRKEVVCAVESAWIARCKARGHVAPEMLRRGLPQATAALAQEERLRQLVARYGRDPAEFPNADAMRSYLRGRTGGTRRGV